MNRNKHIWEGWTVGSFIDELEPMFDIVQDNIRIAEQQETQSIASQAQQSLQEEMGNRQVAFDDETAAMEQAMLEGEE